MTRYAVISAGTNSCRLLIAVRSGKNLSVERQASVGTRLGEGIGADGGLSPVAIERTLAAVRQFVPRVGQSDRLFAIGTSALREAANAKMFLKPFARLVGIEPSVLSSEEEALASFHGAMQGLSASVSTLPACVSVVDVGGGSAEFAVRRSARGRVRVASLPLGAVRLTERFITSDPPQSEDLARCRAAVRRALHSLPEDARPQGALVAVGGTANTAARMLGAAKAKERKENRPVTLARADLTSLLGAVSALPLRWRKRLAGLPSQRADIFPAGLLVLETVASEFGAKELTVCQSDLLLGYVALHV